MITEKIKELEALKERAAELEAAVAAERQRELATLPGKYGFEDVYAFVDAVIEASGAPGRRRGHSPRGARSNQSRKPRRPRTTITEQMRAEVKKLVESGKTGAEIAVIVGISLPSVQNVKKALGLVQPRK
jgi:DNA-binding CsgD family transcriptional regulator